MDDFIAFLGVGLLVIVFLVGVDLGLKDQPELKGFTCTKYIERVDVADECVQWAKTEKDEKK